MGFPGKSLLLVALLALGLPATRAADVPKDVIRLGQTADLSGSRAGNAKEFNAGALLYFDFVNRRGGVHGRRIELITRDDAYKVDQTVTNAKTLIEKDNVFLIFAPVGTENFIAIEEKVTTPARVPIYAPSSGAAVLREPYKRYVFPLRGSNHAEMEKIIQQLTTIGVTRVSLFYDDDSFGRDILTGVERAMAKRNLKLHSVASIDREGTQMEAAAKKIGPTAPQATIVGSAGSTALRFVREMQKQGYDVPFYMNSGVNLTSLTKELSQAAHGIVLAQLMPSVDDASVPVTREFKKMAGEVSGTPLTSKALEGFVGGKVLVEALKRAGKDLTREKFVVAMETLDNFDVGGIYVSYTPTFHRGLDYVDLAVISRSGKTLR